ncbi:MAG TPA: AAA family ATPase, partial [Herpetosiphonaceae bacterium]|nr:AAA family ATPase [Herpetosiphonaceae bacterium]
MTRSHPAVQADLAIYLFGELCVEIGGAPVKLNVPPKTIPLWVYLLLKRHASVSRTDLAARIWPDIPKAKARANLRRHLHHLQRMLPPHRPGLPWLIHDGEHIQWNPDADYWLDVGEFERLMAHNARLDQAVALYTGDVLPYLDDEWVFFERERLRLVYLTLLDSLVNYATARGDYAQAMTYAVRLVSQDPHREDASCRLMRLQYQAGDRAGVFAEYERLVTSLKQDLGLEPLPETVIFYKRLCQNDLPALDGCDLRAVGSYGIVDRLPFAGRNLEMAQMKSWWSQAVRGRGSVVLVQGQAGIGKTRIADELAAAVDPAWASVLRGTVTFGEPLSYQPILMALRAALPRLDTHALPRLRAATLMAVLPELKELYPDVQPLPVRDGDIDRKRLFDALVHCFFSLAKARPTLLIVEDMHWAGAATWAFLEYMAQQITPVPILVLVTCRDGEHLQNIAAQKAIARMGKRSMLRQLSLGPLAEPTIAGLLATASVPGAEVHTIAPLLYRISGGHPFFLGQLISHLAEGASPRDLPHDIHTVMRQRLDRLSPEAQQLAAVAAVIGTAFDIELLCEAGDWSESVLQPLVAELTERQLIREAGISAGYDYLFGHHVIQMAIYNRIPVATRARLHSRIGDLLEQVYDVDQPAIVRSLAGHFESAGQSAKAAAYYLAAARHAFSVYADEAAIDDASRG